MQPQQCIGCMIDGRSVRLSNKFQTVHLGRKRTESLMKYRVHAKNTNIIIKGKPAFGEKINERELDYLLKNTVPGFFHISYDGKKQLEYEAPAALPLAKYLKDEKLDEQSFWKVMAQMVDAQIAAKSRGLYPDHILTKPDMVFIEEETLKMYFIYQPVSAAKDLADNLFAVIHDIIYQEMKKEGGLGANYLIDFQNYLQQSDYRPEHVRQYISRASGEGAAAAVGSAAVHSMQEAGESEDLEQYTVMLGSGGAAGGGVKALPKSMQLIRIRTKERKTITGDVIRLGRSSQNEYCITGNGSIGRVHAVIERRGDVWWLKDMGSVNGTFVSGRRMTGQQAYRLKSGDRFQLADEEFVFEIKQ